MLNTGIWGQWAALKFHCCDGVHLILATTFKAVGIAFIWQVRKWSLCEVKQLSHICTCNKWLIWDPRSVLSTATGMLMRFHFFFFFPVHLATRHKPLSKRAMKTGRIISGWCLANNPLELGKKVSSRRHHHTLFFYAYYSNGDSRAADFLEMSVQFRASSMTCMICSVSGLTGYESPGNTLRVDHSCSEKDVPFPRFLCMFPEDFRKSIWLMYQAGKRSVTSGPLRLHLPIMCPGWDYASQGSTSV